jgi:hypothetical protein
MRAHYLEIVSDVDTLTALYQGMHGLSFGPPDADLERLMPIHAEAP